MPGHPRRYAGTRRPRTVRLPDDLDDALIAAAEERQFSVNYLLELGARLLLTSWADEEEGETVAR